MIERHLIYALQDPVTGEIRYVGRSSSGLKRARERHLDAHCGKWTAKLLRFGLKPKALILQQFDSAIGDINAVLNDAEVYWIAEGRRRGWPLTNTAIGGKGSKGVAVSESCRRKVSAMMAGRVVSQTTKDRIAESARVRWSNSEFKKLVVERVAQRFSAEQVMEIRRIYAAGGTSSDKLAIQFNVSRVTIMAIIAGRTWKHLPVLHRDPVEFAEYQRKYRAETARLARASKARSTAA